MTHAIDVREISRHFDRFERGSSLGEKFSSFLRPKTIRSHAVVPLNLKIERGESVGLIGSNGAGKTTLMKMIAGLLHPSSGHIEVLGFKPFERKAEFLRQIGMVMGQKSQLWLDIPALETYDLLASIYRIPSPLWRDRVDSLAQLFQVHKQLKTPVRRLSLGERMKLEIIASLLHQPKLLILDEPTIGLDVVARRNIRSFLRDYIRQEKTTLLLSSHDMSDIAELCPRLVILQQGRLQYDGWVKDFERLHPEALFKKVALDFDFGAAISIEDWHKLADAHGAKLESQEVLSPVFLVPVGELGALVGQVLKHGTPIDIRVEETSLESLVHSMLVKS